MWGVQTLFMGYLAVTTPNKSMDTNRRRFPLDVAPKLDRAVHAPARVSTAVGHLSC